MSRRRRSPILASGTPYPSGVSASEGSAEFVADEKTQRIVTRLGVDYAQGYYIGRPIPITALLETLADPSPDDSERATASQQSNPDA